MRQGRTTKRRRFTQRSAREFAHPGFGRVAEIEILEIVQKVTIYLRRER